VYKKKFKQLGPKGREGKGNHSKSDSFFLEGAVERCRLEGKKRYQKAFSIGVSSILIITGGLTFSLGSCNKRGSTKEKCWGFKDFSC